MSRDFTFARSGVSVSSADAFVPFMSLLTSPQHPYLVPDDIGSFGSVSRLPSPLKDVHLVASTDGVGTNIAIAHALYPFAPLGIDLVAMSVIDILVQGGGPFLFLACFSVGKIFPTQLPDILPGILDGCKISNCELVGGETAEMPGTYTKGKFDFAGFCVGLVEKNKILKQKNIKKGDIIIGIPSSGLPSNGFSLVSSLFGGPPLHFNRPKKLKRWLLGPARI
jgi:Phosphoribosylaminoimidazole (AIR) synthetase